MTIATRLLFALFVGGALLGAGCGSPITEGGTGGTGTGGSTGGANTGGSPATGGATGGAVSTGGATGGRATGGTSTGGTATGGAATGGATGGASAGGAAAGGASATGGTSGAFDPCPATGDCKVLPLGDSITFGTPTNNGGYRVQLFTKARGDSKKLTFVGSQANGPQMVAGATFPRGSEGYPGWTIMQIDGISNMTRALKDSPHIILLHIGTNDMVMTAAGAPDRLDKLIDKLTAALPNSLLAVSNIIPLPLGANAVMTYNAAVPGVVQKKIAAGKHLIFVEMNKGFPDNGLANDKVHPNDNVGYPWMGDSWYAAIKPYLH